MTLKEIENAIWEQRRVIFSSNDEEAEKASQKIKELAAMLDRHPDEVKRRAAVKRKADERFWFRTL